MLEAEDGIVLQRICTVMQLVVRELNEEREIKIRSENNNGETVMAFEMVSDADRLRRCRGEGSQRTAKLIEEFVVWVALSLIVVRH